MTNKLFDSFIKEKLDNYQSPVPTGLWEKIVEEDERKPIAFWWWNKNAMLLGLMLFATIAGATYYYFNTNTNKQISATAEYDNKENSANEATAKISSKINNNTENNNHLTEKILPDNSTTSSIIDTDKANEPIANKAFESNGNINTTSKNNTYSPINVPKATKNDVANNIVSSTKNEIKSSGKLLASATNYKQIFYTKKRNTANSFSMNIDNTDVTTTESFTLQSKTFSTANIATLEANLYKTNTLKEKQVLSIGKLFSGTDDCPSARGTYRNDLYIEGYASPDFAHKTVKSTVGGNDNYLQKKDSSEVMRLGFTVGARFSKSITNNLLLKAGLQYSQFNEKFTLRTENDRRQTIIINSHTITRPGLSDTTISDTSIYVQIGYRVRSNINRYKNLEIPLMLSYEMSQPESKWKLAINAGAIINITSWYEGKTIDAGYNLVNISNKSSNGVYQNKVGVSLYTGLSIIRNINEQLDVFAEPYYRYGISNSVQSNSGFNQKFNVIGLQFGARLKINKSKHL